MGEQQQQPSHVVVSSPNRVEPPLIQTLSDSLWAIAGNYAREGTCTPGGRFEGRTLEAVQAEYVLTHAARLGGRGTFPEEPSRELSQLLAMVRVSRLLHKWQRDGEAPTVEQLEQALRPSGLV